MQTTGPQSSRRFERGVTLIELMIAMLLGLLLTAALVQMFIANRATYALNEQLARVQENGRIALEMISRRIRMAGYYGCVSDLDPEENMNSIVDAPGNAFAYALGRPLEGFEFLGTSPADSEYALQAGDVLPSGNAQHWDPPLDADLLNAGVLPGSDVVAIRNLSIDSVPVWHDPGGQGQGQGSAPLHVAHHSGFQAGQIAAASDCTHASVFQITSVNSSASTVVHAAQSGNVSPGNISPPLLGHHYQPGSDLYLMETWAFYVGRSSRGGPALFQRRLNNSGSLVSEEIVEGVESMQILYGVDDSGDGAIDAYLTAAQLGPAASAAWNRVLTVRVALLIRSPDEYGSDTDDAAYLLNDVAVKAPGDRRYRQVFTTTIGIRNRMP